MRELARKQSKELRKTDSQSPLPVVYLKTFLEKRNAKRNFTASIKTPEGRAKKDTFKSTIRNDSYLSFVS
jgi:hypothetical protein